MLCTYCYCYTHVVVDIINLLHCTKFESKLQALSNVAPLDFLSTSSSYTYWFHAITNVTIFFQALTSFQFSSRCLISSSLLMLIPLFQDSILLGVGVVHVVNAHMLLLTYALYTNQLKAWKVALNLPSHFFLFLHLLISCCYNFFLFFFITRYYRVAKPTKNLSIQPFWSSNLTNCH